MDKTKTYFVKTYGCQANKADSEKIAAFLDKKGLKETPDIKEANLVVINTCSVRQTAEDRIGGLVRNLVLQRKRTGKPKKIVLTGCALYHGKTWLRKRLKEIDEFIPSSALIDPKILPKRKDKTHAWVPIMEGCSHFCTYCVVPLARGREISRPFEEIVCEVKGLVRRGYKEITLVGQNVNSYGKDLKNSKLAPSPKRLWRVGDKTQNAKLQPKFKSFKTPFGKLLAALNEIEGIEKIFFITSNPWDLTDDVIAAMALPKITRFLHLPVQSGDDEILRRMNRPYTADQYLKLIKKIRQRIPSIEIGTDIIVGFPGETKKQFENTVKLCKQVGFSVAYVAKYSPRPGTVASKFPDTVPPKEKKRRWKVLDDLINQRQKTHRV